MSKDLNQCNFIGRLGKDPEKSVTKQGMDVCKFSIACGDDYKDKQGNKVERTNWVNCVAFNGLAGVCGQWLKKGDQVFVSGKQVTQKWQDKEGNNRYTTEIVLNELQMLGGRSESQTNDKPSHDGAQQNNSPSQSNDFDDFDQDLPF